MGLFTTLSNAIDNQIEEDLLNIHHLTTALNTFERVEQIQAALKGIQGLKNLQEYTDPAKGIKYTCKRGKITATKVATLAE